MDVRKYDVPITQPKKLSKKQIDIFKAFYLKLESPLIRGFFYLKQSSSGDRIVSL